MVGVYVVTCVLCLISFLIRGGCMKPTFLRPLDLRKPYCSCNFIKICVGCRGSQGTFP